MYRLTTLSYVVVSCCMKFPHDQKCLCNRCCAIEHFFCFQRCCMLLLLFDHLPKLCCAVGFCLPAIIDLALFLLSTCTPRGGHSITKHTGGLTRRSESKTQKYLSKNSNNRKMLKSYPLNILKVYSPRAQRLAILDKFSFSLRTVPLIVLMNHFSYPLTIVQINIFEEPQDIFSQLKSQTPRYRASPPPPPPHSIFNNRVPTPRACTCQVSRVQVLKP